MEMRFGRRRGFSFIELLVVVAIIGVIVMAAVPYYKAGVMNAHEIAAMRAIQALHAAEMQFYSQNDRFAASLAELGPKMISPELATGKKGGYQFRIDLNPDGYGIHADPVTFDVSGSRTFYSDQTMIIRENRGSAPATAESPEAK
jgi:prepilin-type N-terminal cleavage/methylation domain-containing protein